MKPTRRSRFENEPREMASLYLAEFDDGTIKVGQSDNPRRRLLSLEYEAHKRYGIAMVRWKVFAGAGFAVAGGGRNWRHACSFARRMEQRCIAHFTSIARVRGPGREFFLGLDFDAAMQHVYDVIRQQQGKSTKCGDVCVFHAKNFCVSEPINANQLCGASL